MARTIEIRSKKAGEVDTFYRWLKTNRPELLDIPGLEVRYHESGIMGMPGKTVIKFIYRGPDEIPASVAHSMAELRQAIDDVGGSLEMEEQPEVIGEKPKPVWRRILQILARGKRR